MLWRGSLGYYLPSRKEIPNRRCLHCQVISVPQNLRENLYVEGIEPTPNLGPKSRIFSPMVGGQLTELNIR
jgi:hypothetical protein